MKKVFFVVLVSLFLTSCSNIGNQVEYTKHAKSAVGDSDFLSFCITRHIVFSGKEDSEEKFYLIYNYDDKQPSFTFINSDSTRFMKYDNKNYFLADFNNREIAQIEYKGEGKDVYYMMKNHTENIFREMPYYHQLLGKRFVMSNVLTHEGVTDTTIRNVDYKIFMSKTPLSHIYNKETQKYDIPLQYAVKTYINPANNHIDSVCSENITENVFKEKITYIISDISYDDKTAFLDSIYNFNDKRYSGFSYHNENNLPYSMRNSSNTEINDSILNYPLVSLSNDTSYLQNREVWTLLNFWSLNCPPCIENLHNYKHEKDSLGYRILENEGIEILAINYDTDNMELLKNMAEKTNSADIIYSAKGIKRYISIPYLGYYYLISPDKEVVFKDYKLGDYSDLLKAKEEHEKKNIIR